MARVYYCYKLPGDHNVLDILKHYQLELKHYQLEEELKELKEELKELKEKLDPGHQRLVSLTNQISSTNYLIANQTGPNVDSSKYRFSSSSWGEISVDTHLSDLLDKGVGKDIKSAIHIIEKGENILPFAVALF